MAENKVTLRFNQVRETKNTIRFEEQSEVGLPPVVGTIYVQKWWAHGAKVIMVTLDKG